MLPKRSKRILNDPGKTGEIRDALLSGLRYEEGVRLYRAYGEEKESDLFSYCICRCERKVNEIPPDEAAQAWGDQVFHLLVPFLRHPAANTRGKCSAKATWTNPATGELEPSICEDKMPPLRSETEETHQLPNGEHSDLACRSCKRSNGVDLRWRLEQLKFGVCKLCRQWAIANVAVGDHCVCMPTQERSGVANNYELRIDNLCAQHADRWWCRVADRAKNEINTRRHILRDWPPKEPGRAKKGPLTPLDRRNAVKWGQNYQVYARCVCGAVLGRVGHVRGAVETDRVRNCVGCGGWVRRW